MPVIWSSQVSIADNLTALPTWVNCRETLPLVHLEDLRGIASGLSFNICDAWQSQSSRKMAQDPASRFGDDWRKR